MPSFREWLDRPKVHVDWHSYGICLYWMLGGHDRCYALQDQGHCKFVHPPLERLSDLWTDHYARLEYATKNPADPRWRPVMRMDELDGDGWADGHEDVDGYGYERAPPPAGHHVAEPERTPPPRHRARSGRLKSAPHRRHGTQADELRGPRSRDLDDLMHPDMTSMDAPPSPKPSGSTIEASNANAKPVEGANKLLDRGDEDVPSAAARTVWTRNNETRDQMETTPSNNEHQPEPVNKSAPKQKHMDRLNASEVQRPSPPKEESQASLVPEAANQPATATDVARNAMPPPRLPLAGKATPYNKRSPPPLPPPPPPPRDRNAKAGAAGPSAMAGTKRLSNGEPKPASAPAIGPHPSTIRVAAPYTTQASIEKGLYPGAVDHHDRSLAEAKEDAYRLQGVTWIDSVRRSLQLPIKTFTTACCLYHKFRLQHPGADYAFADAAAASLLASCKIEDTLKKSRDILAAAYNLKLSAHDALGPDDVVFEAPSRVVIGIERLILESGGFDFRSVRKHEVLIKIAKAELKGFETGSNDVKKVADVGFTVLTDLHRTFAPMKHTTSTQAAACLEMAAHLEAAKSPSVTAIRDHLQKDLDYKKWGTTRENVMESLLDLLDLYTHHTTSTILGTKYSLDDLLRIRLALNKECSDNAIPRYQTVPESAAAHPSVNGATLQVANGHPTPVSPPDPDAQVIGQPIVTGVPPVPEGGGTLRFVLNPKLAAEEKAEVQKFFTEEWEEYEEELEIPLPKPPKPAAPTRSMSCERDTRPPPPPSISSRGPSRDHSRDRAPFPPRRPPHSGPPPARGLDSRRSREDLRDRERDYDRRSDYDRFSDVDDRDRGFPPPPRGFDNRRPRDDFRDRERDRARDRDRDRDRDYRRDSRRYDDRRYDDRYERRDRRDEEYYRRSRR
ncbi:hypothetical protein KC363_g8236 [Hortaea werneckii]|nr:hypothetical protein KC361_g1503 [Hortaea werneckii]KAI7183444.1 hypothetical protein KC363_g8236 [Hortaea werneckii]